MIHLSPDHYLYDSDGCYVWTPDRSAYAWKETMRRYMEYLSTCDEVLLTVGVPGSGKSTWIYNQRASGAKARTLVVDATFIKKEHREPFIKAALSAQKRISAVLFETPISVCLERNSKRSPDRVVPYLEGFASSLAEEPPTTEEGFSQVIRVPA